MSPFLHRAAVSVLVVLVTVGAAAARKPPPPVLVYDGEYGGYVAIVDGIQRPDLTADDTGRVAPDREEALALYRRNLKRAAREDERGDGVLAVPGGTPRARPSRRFLRRVAVRTELFVSDPSGRPVEGARVFRYHDPSFYAYNVGRHGGRLVDGYRLRPFPFGSRLARDLLRAYHDRWEDAGALAIASPDPDFDLEVNPWVRWHRAESLPPLEFVGTTDAGGRLEAVSGVFNLLREDRFPEATMPSAVRIGYLVLADGYLLAETLSRCRDGGLEETRNLVLEPAPGHALLASDAFRALLATARSAGARAADDPVGVESTLVSLLDLTVPAVAVPADDREEAMRRGRAAILRAAASRAPLGAREPLLRRALDEDPGSGHLHHQLGLTLAARRGVYPYEPPGRLGDDPVLREAEAAAVEAIRLAPLLAPAYALLDRLLAERRAGPAERAAHLEKLVRRSPFDRWARARLASLALDQDAAAVALEHLPFTWAAGTRLGVDVPLARALAGYYRRQGLPEKAGYYGYAATGHVPEDAVAGFPGPDGDASRAPEP